MQWSIYGEKGEILITATGLALQIGYPDMAIKVHDFGSGKVEVVDFNAEEKLGDLPFPGRNVGRVYDGIAHGRIARDIVTFEDAVERHAFIEGLYKENGYTEGT